MWRPAPKLTVFDSSDECMVTPPSDLATPVGDHSTNAALKRKASKDLEVIQSASPALEKNKNTVRKMPENPPS